MGEAAHKGRRGLNFSTWPWRDPIKNYFPLPNEIFLLRLKPGELAVYAYLMYCENRKTYQCYPSYRTITEHIDMSENTVSKYAKMLEERGLITTEPTSICTRYGRKRNGSLLYTIQPIRGVLDDYYAQQMLQLEEEAETKKIMDRLENSPAISGAVRGTKGEAG